VTFFLVQNGVMAAPDGREGCRLRSVAERGKFACSQTTSRCASAPSTGARSSPAWGRAPIDEVVDLLAAGAKALWHW